MPPSARCARCQARARAGAAIAATDRSTSSDAGGLLTLVASPHLTQADVDAMLAGYESRDEVVARALR